MARRASPLCGSNSYTEDIRSYIYHAGVSLEALNSHSLPRKSGIHSFSINRNLHLLHGAQAGRSSGTITDQKLAPPSLPVPLVPTYNLPDPNVAVVGAGIS